MNYQDRRQQLITVFQDTMLLCEENAKIKDCVKQSIQNQQLILESESIDIKQNESRYDTDLRIVVSKKRSLEAASEYKGKRVCVHNFASATNPGGGVTRGSNAQEECLCRCSTLYPCISDRRVKQGFHDMHRSMLYRGSMDALYNDDCIYTPDVLVMKSDTVLPELLQEEQWYKVDVITCAAPNLRNKPSNSMNPGSGNKSVKIENCALKELHAKRANRILDIAKANGAEVVILGAFGCGAFQNPPEIAAQGIYEAIKSHIHDFETIEFAVYCPPGDSKNYDAFLSGNK